MKKKFEGELLGCLPEAGAVLAADERIETRPEKRRFLGLPERFGGVPCFRSCIIVRMKPRFEASLKLKRRLHLPVCVSFFG
ncbi:MAG: hypothetical protein KHY61_08065 [Sutterella wadsworthensis]|nr:hypothetical protein [Sutterella wadsworthensis]